MNQPTKKAPRAVRLCLPWLCLSSNNAVRNVFLGYNESRPLFATCLYPSILQSQKEHLCDSENLYAAMFAMSHQREPSRRSWFVPVVYQAIGSSLKHTAPSIEI